MAKKPPATLPEISSCQRDTLVASLESARYNQQARLILKVASTSTPTPVSACSVSKKGRTTIDGALAAQRETLVAGFKIDGNQFDFPTNGSSTPDSRATLRALVQLLTAVTQRLSPSMPPSTWWRGRRFIRGVHRGPLGIDRERASISKWLTMACKKPL
ncbi:MAG TPA: hypothetical protein VFQ37_06690 [Mycobacterium sp.]|nr:hypothetical protein [Mycobacterium sp.]